VARAPEADDTYRYVSVSCRVGDIAVLESIVCPSCGERDRAKMTPRRDGKLLYITCRSCGHHWQHSIDTCPGCGHEKLVPVRMPLLQKARGTQQSIIGYWMAQRCTNCGWTNANRPPDTNAAQ
jgi:uncharacterized Zn finger protein